MRFLRALPTSLLVLVATASLPPASAEDDDQSGGLQIEHTTTLACSRPSRAGDRISVNYRGRLKSTGALFDESYKRGSPFTFTLGAGQVIAGWDQGLLDMCPGEGRILTIPPELAYGEANMGVIPPHSTLVFETELVDIVGVKQETLSMAATSTTVSSTEEGAFSIATAPSSPPTEGEAEDEHEDEDEDELVATPLEPEVDDGVAPEQEEDQAECHLLGPFALLVQGALGAMAVLSLVYKRYRETAKRPWKIWFFDVSKQVFGSMLTHVLNLAMSMLSSVDMVNQAKAAGVKAADAEGRMPNPCSFYLLNLAIDTTLGIPVLYLLLKVLHGLFLHTPMARPAESVKSGNYGQPPKVTWYLKQLLIYFLGLVGMKLFVFFLFGAMPFLPWIGDWALRWTKGNEALEVTFAMFIFPLIMNVVQYYVIDNFIMDKKGSKQDSGYEQVHGDDDDEERDVEDGDYQGNTEVEEDADRKAHSGAPTLAEANPTPVPQYGGGEGSRSPPKAEDEELTRP